MPDVTVQVSTNPIQVSAQSGGSSIQNSLAAILIGLNTGLTGQISSSDTILQAFGRLQYQISNIDLSGVDLSGLVSISGDTMLGILGFINGAVAAPAVHFGDSSTGFYRSASNVIAVTISGTKAIEFLSSGLSLAGDSLSLSFGVTPDVFLKRVSAGILSLENSTSPQQFRVYGSTTGSKYLAVKHDGTNSILVSSAGNIQMGEDSAIISLGGSSSSFPALKRNGAAIDFRLGDDSGYCFIKFKGVIEEVFDLSAGSSGPATFNLDFSLAGIQRATITEASVFSSSNLEAGKSMRVILTGSGSGLTLSFPGGWTFIGSAAPTEIASGKKAVLSLFSQTASDSDVIAVYAEQP